MILFVSLFSSIISFCCFSVFPYFLHYDNNLHEIRNTKYKQKPIINFRWKSKPKDAEQWNASKHIYSTWNYNWFGPQVSQQQSFLGCKFQTERCSQTWWCSAQFHNECIFNRNVYSKKRTNLFNVTTFLMKIKRATLLFKKEMERTHTLNRDTTFKWGIIFRYGDCMASRVDR